MKEYNYSKSHDYYIKYWVMIAETVVGKHDTIFLSEVLLDFFFSKKPSVSANQHSVILPSI